jgi:hypothetical protein
MYIMHILLIKISLGYHKNKILSRLKKKLLHPTKNKTLSHMMQAQIQHGTGVFHPSRVSTEYRRANYNSINGQFYILICIFFLVPFCVFLYIFFKQNKYYIRKERGSISLMIWVFCF